MTGKSVSEASLLMFSFGMGVFFTAPGVGWGLAISPGVVLFDGIYSGMSIILMCIAFGALVGALVFPDISLWAVCVLSTMLAATDAALGKGVVSNEAVPNRIRQGLNAESGLNDGLAVPFLFVFLALANTALMLIIAILILRLIDNFPGNYPPR